MFGKFFAKPKAAPPNNYGDVKKLLTQVGPSRGGEIIRAAAIAGNTFCQKFLSESALTLASKGNNEEMWQDAWTYTEMAARSGDADSQFNLGKLYIGRIDTASEYLSESDEESFRLAKHWYGMAAEQGHKRAKEFLKELEDDDV